ncbi:MAG: AAA family ATPase, partial [Deltaproteobacteria bacterium]|nr:AAA family ATPase [Deltaproteobacteria bacterium]
MFRSSRPVTEDGFFDREKALARIASLVSRLSAGSPEWLAIIGPRKVGKTSLLLEAERRLAREDLAFVVFDVSDSMAVSLEAFRSLAVRVVDAVLGAELGVALSRTIDRPAEYRAALLRSSRFLKLPTELRSTLIELPDRALDEGFVRDAIDVPEALARHEGKRLVVAIDEFQELAALGSRSGALDPLPLMRSRWQRHAHVAYVISGSARTTLTELVTSARSPFFQHFALMELDVFSTEDALGLLADGAPEDRPIPEDVARRAVEVLGGHPFYLQLLGEALTEQPPPYDERSLKEALQTTLFSRTGRLSLYFQNEHQRLVGRSTGLSATLDALASGPRRMTEVAKAIGGSTGTAHQYLSRLGDAVRVLDDGRYALEDAAFAAWLRWRAPGGTVVPMRALGDEAEASVAELLSRMGFDLVYQSRGSRGAFDLLATRGADQLGVQVKRSRLPLRFS